LSDITVLDVLAKIFVAFVPVLVGISGFLMHSMSNLRDRLEATSRDQLAYRTEVAQKYVLKDDLETMEKRLVDSIGKLDGKIDVLIMKSGVRP
jgi:hypothetical protein